jgi:hypothetical protein
MNTLNQYVNSSDNDEKIKMLKKLETNMKQHIIIIQHLIVGEYYECNFMSNLLWDTHSEIMKFEKDFITELYKKIAESQRAFMNSTEQCIIISIQPLPRMFFKHISKTSLHHKKFTHKIKHDLFFKPNQIKQIIMDLSSLKIKMKEVGEMYGMLANRTYYFKDFKIFSSDVTTAVILEHIQSRSIFYGRGFIINDFMLTCECSELIRKEEKNGDLYSIIYNNPLRYISIIKNIEKIGTTDIMETKERWNVSFNSTRTITSEIIGHIKFRIRQFKKYCLKFRPKFRIWLNKVQMRRKSNKSLGVIKRKKFNHNRPFKTNWKIKRKDAKYNQRKSDLVLTTITRKNDYFIFKIPFIRIVPIEVINDKDKKPSDNVISRDWDNRIQSAFKKILKDFKELPKWMKRHERLIDYLKLKTEKDREGLRFNWFVQKMMKLNHLINNS